MTFRKENEAKTCIVCGGITPSWTSNTTTTSTLHTPWGEFVVYHHTVCYNKELVGKKLTEIALAAKPDDMEIPPEAKKDDSENNT